MQMVNHPPAHWIPQMGNSYFCGITDVTAPQYGFGVMHASESDDIMEDTRCGIDPGCGTISAAWVLNAPCLKTRTAQSLLYIT